MSVQTSAMLGLAGRFSDVTTVSMVFCMRAGVTDDMPLAMTLGVTVTDSARSRRMASSCALNSGSRSFITWMP